MFLFSKEICHPESTHNPQPYTPALCHALACRVEATMEVLIKSDLKRDNNHVRSFHNGIRNMGLMLKSNNLL